MLREIRKHAYLLLYILLCKFFNEMLIFWFNFFVFPYFFNYDMKWKDHVLNFIYQAILSFYYIKTLVKG